MRKAFCDLCGRELHGDREPFWIVVNVQQKFGAREKTVDLCKSCNEQFWKWICCLSKEVLEAPNETV